MSEEENHGEAISEEVKLAKFGEKVIRSPKGGAFERLIAQHLVLSVSSDPIDSILHSCRSALALPNDTAKKLSIDKTQVANILTVALNFKHAQARNDSEVEMYSVIWSFSKEGKEGFDRYIKPWFNSQFAFYLTHEETSIYPEKFREWEKKASYWELFYHGCLNLPVHTFQALLSAFTSWAYPQAEELNQKVSTQISPTTYTEILGLFNKFQREQPRE